MRDEYTGYMAVVDAVRCYCRSERRPGLAAQAMMRAVRVLQETMTEEQIVALAKDREAWARAVSPYVRLDHSNVLDVSLSREIVPLLILAIEEESIEVQEPAPIPKGKHFTAILAARMAAQETR
ncbi:hypothetical protein [Agrobacterium pusense]|uniref:hypothetical protein n=1 Tax=Agrobacterium pusense TaxID=648995 RepID=UPI000D3C0A47|nr:hypothetical protein [Agrobacterium pusense]PTV70233.1 hypothetical protein DBL06_25555 [Agrobacterium pusense]